MKLQILENKLGEFLIRRSIGVLWIKEYDYYTIGGAWNDNIKSSVIRTFTTEQSAKEVIDFLISEHKQDLIKEELKRRKYIIERQVYEVDVKEWL